MLHATQFIRGEINARFSALESSRKALNRTDGRTAPNEHIDRVWGREAATTSSIIAMVTSAVVLVLPQNEVVGMCIAVASHPIDVSAPRNAVLLQNSQNGSNFEP